ncbi:flavin reductase family protein [Clostridium frigidicarnis]|uniref:Flavin reductase like domain-containing protein n=1 Tax=Clostridium frigidicarnis TaxID=84698 RepID=A0A1I0XHK5_9CLOT|nr:flavin reductase family protein [Clostridium frigidicarnis]SFB00492.1 Flavin reductase like domain-containing protein [Clostridium frigidicarnis]
MEFYNNLGMAMENLIKRGAFLTCKTGEKINTMTISWGYVGFSWRKPYFVAMVRPERYTNKFMNEGEDFTISIPYSDDMKNALMICGTKSGRNIDKEKEANIEFISSKSVKSPIINNCNMYYECKVSYVDPLKSDNLPKDIKEKFYNGDGDHIMYYGEIVNSYEK